MSAAIDPSSRAPRLVLLLTSLNLGGAQAQAVRMATALAADGVDVRVISMIPAERYTDELDEGNVPWRTLGMAPGRPDPRGAVALIRMLRAWRPDIVHAHMVHANLLARAVRPLARIPALVCTAHSIDEGGRAREIAYRLTDRLADHTTNVSAAAVRRYVAVRAAPAHKISVMPNGVDVQRFRPDPETRSRARRELGLAPEQFTWLAAGRFDEAKDYPNMLDAYARSRATAGPGKLLIAGDGPGFDAVARIRDERGQQDVVTLLGRRDDMPHLMAAADAFLLSSAWEGLPMVLLEAAAAGLPIVATDVGGNGEIVAEGSNGLLVPPRDPDRLAEAIRRLESSSDEDRRAMARAGRERAAERYGLDGVLDRWRRLYDELLARRGLSAGRGFAAP